VNFFRIIEPRVAEDMPGMGFAKSPTKGAA
jgi:GTP-binding protein EngB required for normal cell division